MWPLVLTGALGSQKQEGSVLGPHACFIVCVGCLTAECRQINPETSASTHKHTNWTERGRTETALCRLVSGNRLNSSGEYFLLIYLSVCLLCLWLFICLFLLSVSHGRKRKESMSPSFSLSLSLSLSQQLSIYSGQVVNPTTTKGTACKSGGEGILSVNLISSDYISGLTPSSCIPSVTKCKKARAQYIKTYSITHGSIKTSCYVLLKVNVNQADWLGKHSDLKATSQDSVCGRETPTYTQTCKWISVLLYRAMRW